MNEENKMVLVIKESGIEKTQSETILTKFQTFFEQASEWEIKAKGLVVKDETEIEKMEQSREARLALKKIRVDAEKVRKELKEDGLRVGRAIDGVYNVIEALIVPIEKHLENQEKFIENIAKEKAQKIKTERTEKMLQYVDDVSVYNFDNMSDEIFENLLKSTKVAWDTKQAELKKIEDERIENEKKQAVFNKRQLELAPYKFFFDATDKKLTIETTEEDFKALLKFFVETKKQFDIDQEEIEKENAKLKEDARLKEIEDAKQKKIDDDKLKAEQDARKKLEDEKAQREADEKKAKAEADEKERLAKLAPEKDKLTAYAESIKNIKCPDELSKAGLAIVKEVEAKLLAISQDIKIKIKEL